MFAGLQISGCDLRTLIGEATGNAKRDLAKSRESENTNPEAMIQIQLNHVPGIQKVTSSLVNLEG